MREPRSQRHVGKPLQYRNVTPERGDQTLLEPGSPVPISVGLGSFCECGTMTAEEATRHMIELCRSHFDEQEEQIARQRVVIEKLDADGHTEQAAIARKVLAELVLVREQTRQELVDAEQRLKAYNKFERRRAG